MARGGDGDGDGGDGGGHVWWPIRSQVGTGAERQGLDEGCSCSVTE